MYDIELREMIAAIGAVIAVCLLYMIGCGWWSIAPMVLWLAMTLWLTMEDWFERHSIGNRYRYTIRVLAILTVPIGFIFPPFVFGYAFILFVICCIIEHNGGMR